MEGLSIGLVRGKKVIATLDLLVFKGGREATFQQANCWGFLYLLFGLIRFYINGMKEVNGN